MALSSSLGFSLILIGIAVWYQWKPSSKVVNKLEQSYDYIVVGAGSAGSVVASRLSEDADVTVAVLEAGADDDNHPPASVPLQWYAVQNTEADWAYRTVPQTKACRGLKEQRSAWPRGKLLGGSGHINSMWYVRGNRHDYDRWENVFGAEGWSYADVLPYFIKSEAHDNEDLVRSGYHGRDGNWKVTVQNRTPYLISLYLNATAELGHEILPEINGKEQEAFSSMSSFVDRKTGRRSESASAFLKPAMERNNLHVITKAQVTKVLIQNKKAVGVEYVKNGRLEKVMANKEVILSSGAIGSPHILMLSGIGHKEHLQKFGIETIADLPVGDNLQDHLMIFPFDFYLDNTDSITTSRKTSYVEVLKYALFGSGVWASSVFEATGFYRTDSQPKDDPRPYMQSALYTSFFGESEASVEMFKNGFSLKDEVADHWLKPNVGKVGFTMFLGLQRVASTGTIRLQSGNPFQYPLIDPKYLHEDSDVENFLYSIRHTQRYMKTKTFQEAGVQQSKRIHPLCKDIPYDSDEYWICFIRADTLTIYHPTSTCKMGKKNDKTTVVDAQLRVHGIKGLRVADASIMPEVVTGNTNAPSVMIGEKAADIIRGRKLPPIKNL